MKFVRHVAAAAALLLASPVLAQSSEWPVQPAEYVEVGMIKVDDGHALDYANHLAGMWRKSQDYAKSQGWITDYEIWTNEFPRDGEPDIWLVTKFTNFADAAETQRRDAAYRAYMKQTEAQMQAASGKRAEYRKQVGTMLFRRQMWTR